MDHVTQVIEAAQQLDRAIDAATLDGLRVTLTIRKQIRMPGPSCDGVAVSIEQVNILGSHP